MMRPHAAFLIRCVVGVIVSVSISVALLPRRARAETLVDFLGGGKTVTASWYGYESGRWTASGERFNPRALTAAHRTLPFGTLLKVCHRGCVVVRVNDRGPAKWTGRALDLSRGAAARIGMLGAGTARVAMEVSR